MQVCHILEPMFYKILSLYKNTPTIIHKYSMRFLKSNIISFAEALELFKLTLEILHTWSMYHMDV